MKKIAALLLLMSITASASTAQKLSYSTVKNQDLTYVLNNIQKTTNYTNNKDLYVQVYNVADPSGSAHTEGTDEITNSIYIAVSEDGESPEQHLYRLSSLLNPKFVNWIKSPSGAKLVISYGFAGKRRNATISISLRKLVID